VGSVSGTFRARISTPVNRRNRHSPGHSARGATRNTAPPFVGSNADGNPQRTSKSFDYLLRAGAVDFAKPIRTTRRPNGSASEMRSSRADPFAVALNAYCAGLNGADEVALGVPCYIHKTPAGVKSRLIPSSPQSLSKLLSNVQITERVRQQEPGQVAGVSLSGDRRNPTPGCCVKSARPALTNRLPSGSRIVSKSPVP